MPIVTSKTRAIIGRAPRWPYTVNWDSPQAQGLLILWPGDPNAPWDINLAGGKPAVIDGSLSKVVRESGERFMFVETVVDFLGTDYPDIDGQNNSVFVRCIHDGPISSLDSRLLNSTSGLSSNTLQLDWNYAGSGLTNQPRMFNFSGAMTVTGGNIAIPGIEYSQAAAFQDDDGELWFDGVSIGTDTSSGLFGTWDRFRIGGANKFADDWNGSIWDVRLYQGRIDSTIPELAQDPATKWDVYHELGRTKHYLPAASAAPDITTGVEFDGTNDYLTRGALTGAADGKGWFFSAAFTVDGGDGTLRTMLHGTNAGAANGSLGIALQSNNKMVVALNPPGSTSNNAQVFSANTILAGSGYHTILVSGLNGTTAPRLYIDGVDDTDSGSSVGTDTDFTLTDWSVGSLYSGISKWDGCLGEVMFGLEYINVGSSTERDKFFTASGAPVDKGSDGSTPTGTAPLIYLSGGADQFADNFGSGGAFSIAGDLVDCALTAYTTTVSPASIVTAEAFGSLTVAPGAVSIVPSAIGSGEAIGDLSLLPGAVTITPSGVATGEALGSPDVSTGGVFVQPSGIASGETHGSPALSADGNTVLAQAIGSAEAIGDLSLLPGAVSITPSGIASAEAVGSLSLDAVVFLTPSAIAGVEAFGSHTLAAGDAVLSVSGIASLEAFGSLVLSGGSVQQGSLIGTISIDTAITSLRVSSDSVFKATIRT